MSDAEASEVVEVPVAALSADVLQALIEEFVTRDGTDYGLHERSTAEKVAAVRKQLERREIRIVFDAESESVNIVSADEVESGSVDLIAAAEALE